jgi:hypothetical protein
MTMLAAACQTQTFGNVLWQEARLAHAALQLRLATSLTSSAREQQQTALYIAQEPQPQKQRPTRSPCTSSPPVGCAVKMRVEPSRSFKPRGSSSCVVEASRSRPNRPANCARPWYCGATSRTGANSAASAAAAAAAGEATGGAGTAAGAGCANACCCNAAGVLTAGALLLLLLGGGAGAAAGAGTCRLAAGGAAGFAAAAAATAICFA